MTPSDDIFALLKLPLDCDDPALIRAAVSRTREACSRGTMTGTDKLACEALLARLPELERVLLDPAARGEAREAARKARGSAREVRLAAFRRDLAMLLSGGRGSLTTAERDHLLSSHSDPSGPSAIELRALITVPVVADARQASAQALPLPAHEARDIAGKLAVLGKRDLYDFLELAPTAASREIEARQRELAASWALKAKATPEKSAAQALLGRVAVLLLAPQKRAGYDATLREARLQPLLGSIALALADGRLSAHEHAHLLAQARDLGITEPEAAAAIHTAAAAAGAVVEVEVAPGPAASHSTPAKPPPRAKATPPPPPPLEQPPISPPAGAAKAPAPVRMGPAGTIGMVATAVICAVGGYYLTTLNAWLWLAAVPLFLLAFLLMLAWAFMRKTKCPHCSKLDWVSGKGPGTERCNSCKQEYAY